MMVSLLFALTLGADPNPAPKIDKQIEETQDVQGLQLYPKRVRQRLLELQYALPIDRPLPDTPLKDILDFLQDIATPPEAHKDPSRRVFLVVDQAAFRKARPDVRIDEEKISLPKMNGATLETTLKMVCDQIDATYLVKGDHILITT